MPSVAEADSRATWFRASSYQKVTPETCHVGYGGDPVSHGSRWETLRKAPSFTGQPQMKLLVGFNWNGSWTWVLCPSI